MSRRALAGSSSRSEIAMSSRRGTGSPSVGRGVVSLSRPRAPTPYNQRQDLIDDLIGRAEEAARVNICSPHDAWASKVS